MWIEFNFVFLAFQTLYCALLIDCCVSLNWGMNSSFSSGKKNALFKRSGGQGVNFKAGLPVGHFWGSQPSKPVISRAQLHCLRVHIEAGSICQEVGPLDEEHGQQARLRKFGIFELLTTLEIKPNDEFSQEIVHHFSLLKTELKHHFLDVTCCGYITNPFSVDPADLSVGTGEQEALIDIQSDETAKAKHKEWCPINFCVSMASWYLTLAHHAVPQLLIFPSTWECEQGFSVMMNIKSKSRNRLAAPRHDFRCAVSKVMPCINQLVEKKQLHSSH